MILAFIRSIFKMTTTPPRKRVYHVIALYKNRILRFKLIKKPPTHPLRLFKTTNVRVSGVTESSGTSYLDNTYSKVISFFSLTLSQ